MSRPCMPQITEKCRRSSHHLPPQWALARRRNGPLEPVDDIIIISNAEVSQDNLSSALKRAFDRASELATRHNLVGPLRLTLSDADARHLR